MDNSFLTNDDLLVLDQLITSKIVNLNEAIEGPMGATYKKDFHAKIAQLKGVRQKIDDEFSTRLHCVAGPENRHAGTR